MLALACGPAGPAPQPNLVVLLVDDLGYGDLGVYGVPDIRTPEIDSLAASGAVFTDAYAASPVCSPTRAALMTGLYPQRLGHQFEDYLHAGSTGLDPARFTTLAEHLRRAGYRTACYGKWNLEGKAEPGRSQWLPNAHGFEHWFGTRGNPDYHTHRTVRRGRPDLYEDGRPVDVPGYTDRLLADHAVRFIEQAAAAGEPFFLYVPWLLVHYPLQAPDDPTIAPTGHRPTYVKMVELLDLQVGRILEALRAAGLERETLVLFTSDNGGHPTARNAPLSGFKQRLAEGGIRVPLILSWSGRIPAGGRFDTPVVTMDLTVTILAAAGLAGVARGMDGIDLLPLVTGAGLPAPRSLFWRRRLVEPEEGVDLIRSSAVRDGEWKLFIEDGKAHLYQLKRDPGERVDLAVGEPKRVARLSDQLAMWERDVEPAGAATIAGPAAPGPP